MAKKEAESELIEKLSPLEIKIIPYLNLPIEQIEEKSGLDSVSVLRALRFLEAKGILKIKTEATQIVDLGTNGIYYKKNHLPERRLLILLETSNHLSLEEAQKLSKLSDNEFKVSLGVLKNKALVSLVNGKLSLVASKEELIKKTLEEQFLDALPLEKSSLKEEQLLAFQNLQKRKDIIEVKQKNIVTFELTAEGKALAGKEIKSDLIEEVTPEIIRDWTRGKKFRKYGIISSVPAIHGGKKHFVNQSIEYAKRIWTDMGFKEMTGSMADSSFWIFDALFTPQDHPAREMQDTFFIKDAEGKLPDKKLVEKVRQAHEKGIGESKGWQYDWRENMAKRVVLRTHTTGLSAKTLANLKPKDMPAKFFAIGKVFRNETTDINHLFELTQTEGIIVDENATLRHLLGYLKEFYKKMGYEKIRIRPSYFPYTEPSLEIEVFDKKQNAWLELGGAGIFRPEVTIPLLGTAIPVLAWGQGFERIIKNFYKIDDLRSMYANDIKVLREKKAWIK